MNEYNTYSIGRVLLHQVDTRESVGKFPLRLLMSSSPPSSPSSSEEVPPWEHAWRDIQPTISSLYSTIASWPKPKARIMRVGQLDAELLDQELTAMLKEPLNKTLWGY